VPDFTTELTLVADEVRRINADHVLWGTVPHVTIPPISRGLQGQLADCNRYFNYYGRIWQRSNTGGTWGTQTPLSTTSERRSHVFLSRCQAPASWCSAIPPEGTSRCGWRRRVHRPG
jgi:hypothetical protein